MKHLVELRQIPEQKLLTVERRVLADALPATIGELGDQLYSYINGSDIQVAGPNDGHLSR